MNISNTQDKPFLSSNIMGLKILSDGDRKNLLMFKRSQSNTISEDQLRIREFAAQAGGIDEGVAQQALEALDFLLSNGFNAEAIRLVSVASDFINMTSAPPTLDETRHPDPSTISQEIV